MKDYINIGSVPSGEDCEQLGQNYSSTKAKKECLIFIQQLQRKFGLEPHGAKLKIKVFPHDFGSYLEVVCYYNDDEEESTNYAFRCESEMPEYWDFEAKKQLNLT